MVLILVVVAANFRLLLLAKSITTTFEDAQRRRIIGLQYLVKVICDAQRRRTRRFSNCSEDLVSRLTTRVRLTKGANTDSMRELHVIDFIPRCMPEAVSCTRVVPTDDRHNLVNGGLFCCPYLPDYRKTLWINSARSAFAVDCLYHDTNCLGGESEVNSLMLSTSASN